MPLTSVGKLDRKQLRGWLRDGTTSSLSWPTASANGTAATPVNASQSRLERPGDAICTRAQGSQR